MTIMTMTKSHAARAAPPAPAAVEVDAQEILVLPERDTLTLLIGNMFPSLSPSTMMDPNSAGTTATSGSSAPTGITNTVGDATNTTTSMANSTVQSAPTQSGATAQNVLSPNATSYATTNT